MRTALQWQAARSCETRIAVDQVCRHSILSPPAILSPPDVSARRQARSEACGAVFRLASVGVFIIGNHSVRRKSVIHPEGMGCATVFGIVTLAIALQWKSAVRPAEADSAPAGGAIKRREQRESVSDISRTCNVHHKSIS
jgi:hypothetical protein